MPASVCTLIIWLVAGNLKRLVIHLVNNLFHQDENDKAIKLFFRQFNFKNVIGQASRLLHETGEVKASFNEEAMPYLTNILVQTQSLDEVAGKFQHQLQGILDNRPVSEEYLQERLAAAIDFFSVKMNNLLETLRQSPATTDSKLHASDYNDGMKMIFSNIAQKSFLMKGLKQKFTVEDFFVLKNTFTVPDFTVNAYARNASTKPLETRQPKLYYELMQLRNRLCEPQDMPIYLVAGSKTLNEMSDFLPQNEKELLLINGFGPAKVEKYGPAFLDVIKAYCTENNLQSLMHEKVSTKKEKGEKKPVGETMRTSLTMYNLGKNIDEIAFTRNLSQTTVISHLEKFIVSRELDINEFITPEKREKASDLIRRGNDTGSIYEMLSTFLNYTEVKMYMAWLRSAKM